MILRLCHPLMSASEPDSDQYRVRRGELSAYGRAANSANTLQRLVVLSTLLIVAVSVVAVFFIQANSAWILLLLTLSAVLSIAIFWFYTRRNFIEPDLAFRKWLQQVCDGELDAKIDLDESHEHYKELHFHTTNLAMSLNRLSTEMETLVDTQTQRLEYQNRSLDLLYNLTADVSKETDKRAVLVTVVRYLHDWFNASEVMAYLAKSERTESLLVKHPDTKAITKNDSFVAPALVQDIQYQENASDPLSHTVSVPIKQGDIAIGVLVIETEHHDPSERARVDQILITTSEQLNLFLTKQSALEHSLTSQMERDRNALAADIHDSLAQTLAALRYQTTLLQESLETKTQSELIADLERIQGTVSEANQEVRGLIHEFRHPLTQQRSADEIRATVENFRQSSGMQVYFQTDEPQLSFSPREESQLQRIIGEALQNAQKYSEASMVRVYLRCTNSGSRRILIEDDGIGFNHLKQADSVSMTENGGNHIGLTIMQERALSVGATLNIETEPGEGTRISIELPPHAKFSGE